MTLPNTRPHGGDHETLARNRGRRPRQPFTESGEPAVHDSASGLFSHPVVSEPRSEPESPRDHRPVFRNAAAEDRQPADEWCPAPIAPGSAGVPGRLFSSQERGGSPTVDEPASGDR